ncbi:helix-turn-helix domain-containing protein [Mesorhizobium sp. M0296]|uniref:helix-turn-helix domain-containing protein n=1 Tax=Mesorhizobium sp. M0296 TaxID=2956931 RepID=UPI00333E1724
MSDLFNFAQRDRRAKLLLIMGDGKVHTADELAEATACNIRTIYRDMAGLKRSGARIGSQAGFGYMLRETRL